MTDTPAEPFATWAIVELMGHLRLAGYASETTIAGAGFIRVDVPGPDGDTRATKYCSPQSVYAITPCDEETVRRTANPPRYVYQPQLEAASTDGTDLEDDDLDEDPDEDGDLFQ